MNTYRIRTRTVALTLAAALCPLVVQAQNPATTGALPTPANRVTGVWTTSATVKPCSNPAAPAMPIRNTLLFNAGGTVLENPGTLPNVVGGSRTIALGTWSYNPATRLYTLFLRFDHYTNGVYGGYQTVDRTFVLSNGGNTAAGPVVTTRYDTNDNQTAQLCGEAVSTRV